MLALTAEKTVQVGVHKLILNIEYEDLYYTPYLSTDTLSVLVRQSVALDYDGIQLPAKVVQDRTETVVFNFMNTGKSVLRNCKAIFDIKGLESGGALFIGDIAVGESKSGNANLRVSAEILGRISGTVTIMYEDEFGESYQEKVPVTTTIEEKVEPTEAEAEEEENGGCS